MPYGDRVLIELALSSRIVHSPPLLITNQSLFDLEMNFSRAEKVGGEALLRRILVAAGAVASVLTLVFLGFQFTGSTQGATDAGMISNVGHRSWSGGRSDRWKQLLTTSASSTSSAAVTPTTTPATTTASSSTQSSSVVPPAPSTVVQPPSVGGYGVPAGTVLRDSGSISIDQDGAVIDALNVRGTVTVNAQNVTIKRSRFTGSGEPWAVRTAGKGSVKIEDSTFAGNYSDAAISYHNWSATRIDISGMSNDGAKLGNNVSLTDSWIHDFKPETGAHGDGVQLVEDVGNIVIKNNKIDIGKLTGVNAAIFLSPDIGPEVPSAGAITVDGNTLGGGGYTLYSVNGRDGATLQSVSITNNTFVKDAIYGPVYASEFVAQTVSGNVYQDGAAITFPR